MVFIFRFPHPPTVDFSPFVCPPSDLLTPSLYRTQHVLIFSGFKAFRESGIVTGSKIRNGRASRADMFDSSRAGRVDLLYL